LSKHSPFSKFVVCLPCRPCATCWSLLCWLLAALWNIPYYAILISWTLLSLLRSGSAFIPELPAATSSVEHRILAGSSPIGIPSTFHTLFIPRLANLFSDTLHTRDVDMLVLLRVCWSHPLTHLTQVLYLSMSTILSLPSGERIRCRAGLN
jgi:hypothetical protein